MSTNQNTQKEIPKFQKCSVKLPYTLACGLHRYIATLPHQKVYVEYSGVTHLYVSLNRRVEILVCNLTSSDCDAVLNHTLHFGLPLRLPPWHTLCCCQHLPQHPLPLTGDSQARCRLSLVVFLNCHTVKERAPQISHFHCLQQKNALMSPVLILTSVLPQRC